MTAPTPRQEMYLLCLLTYLCMQSNRCSFFSVFIPACSRLSASPNNVENIALLAVLCKGKFRLVFVQYTDISLVEIQIKKKLMYYSITLAIVHTYKKCLRHVPEVINYLCLQDAEIDQ